MQKYHRLVYILRVLARRMLLIHRNERRARSKTYLFALVVKMAVKEIFFSLLPENRRNTEKVHGFRIYFPSYSTFCFLFECIFLRREYDFKCDKESPFVIDCGSNIGMSVIWFKWRYPEARIIAFEPDEQAFAHLSNNVRINNLSSVELHQKAVGCRDEQRVFHIDIDDPASLGMSLSKRLYENSSRKVGETTVECVRLSSFLDGPVDILKLDVEGAEYEVLSELHEKGKLSDIREVFIEYHYNESNPENSLVEILQMLKANGYRYIIDSNHHPPYHHYQNRHFKLNIYAYL